MSRHPFEYFITFALLRSFYLSLLIYCYVVLYHVPCSIPFHFIPLHFIYYNAFLLLPFTSSSRFPFAASRPATSCWGVLPARAIASCIKLLTATAAAEGGNSSGNIGDGSSHQQRRGAAFWCCSTDSLEIVGSCNLLFGILSEPTTATAATITKLVSSSRRQAAEGAGQTQPDSNIILMLISSSSSSNCCSRGDCT